MQIAERTSETEQRGNCGRIERGLLRASIAAATAIQLRSARFPAHHLLVTLHSCAALDLDVRYVGISR
jgi:hypothetical protein